METLDVLDYTYLENGEALKCRVFASVRAKLSGIGGKMILKDAAGDVRFHEELTHGEDTLFMYQVLAGGADVAQLHREWYYYRKHGGKMIQKPTVRECSSIYKAECMIRDMEIENGRKENAAQWELAILNTITGWYETGRKQKDAALMKFAQGRAGIEKKEKIFLQVDLVKKLEIRLLSYGIPLWNIHFLCSFAVYGMRFFDYSAKRAAYVLSVCIVHIGRRFDGREKK